MPLFFCYCDIIYLKWGASMSVKDQLYEVEIKSQAILREGQRSLVTYFKGGPKKTIVANVQRLYPQYTNPVDKPVVNITPITFREYKERCETGIIKQKQHLVNASGFIMKEEDYEALGNQSKRTKIDVC